MFAEKSVAALVMFSAQLFHYDSQYTLTVSHDIVFQYILVNEGRSYNSANGRFTASVAGVYMFTVQYCPYTNKKIYLDIVHAGRSLQCSTNWERDDIVCASMQAFAKVAVGDTISVRSRHSGILYHNSNSWNSFSGLLIRV
ncbi:hypothetical protein DPMN_081112 [Dreissena polymorpha]|uniref:C1q domain-containing protein n=1 Tax=Dreissena polymorpha TaxID=45954 RepID=A0A9D3Y5S9_DREPO|nr:hypothetical protein DPMN_081112 [Dreissena polymorpha]